MNKLQHIINNLKVIDDKLYKEGYLGLEAFDFLMKISNSKDDLLTKKLNEIKLIDKDFEFTRFYLKLLKIKNFILNQMTEDVLIKDIVELDNFVNSLNLNVKQVSVKTEVDDKDNVVAYVIYQNKDYKIIFYLKKNFCSFDLFEFSELIEDYSIEDYKKALDIICEEYSAVLVNFKLDKLSKSVTPENYLKLVK